MSDRISDGYRTALRDAKKRETINGRCIDDGFEIVNKMIEGDVRNVTIREPVSP